MKEITDISIIDLAIGFSALLIPLFFFWYYRIGIIKETLISVARMVVQLSLVAVYLEWIFTQNNAYLNSLWVLIMVVVSVFTIMKRVKLRWKKFLLPLLSASIIAILIVDSFFLGVVIRLEYVFDARYFIPITGMILGNALGHTVVGLDAYFNGLKEKADLYYFLLSNTANRKLAIRSYIAEAIKKGLNPLIATTSVMGLISLPGMMTGQILGGSSPAVAIKYQIMIMLAIFVGCTINLLASIFFSNFFIFDAYGVLRKKLMKEEKNKK